MPAVTARPASTTTESSFEQDREADLAERRGIAARAQAGLRLLF